MKHCRPCRFRYCTGCSKIKHGGRPRINAHHCPKHCRHKAEIKKLPPVDVKGVGFAD